VDAIRRDLEEDGWLKRYRTDDGFGVPRVAFALCTFWLVEALGRLGSEAEARVVMARLGDVKSPLGLLAEDLDPKTGEMWGNFPQAYSHVGLIHAAFSASPRWAEVGT
jgi:GH15 family glucan-1,4-alpha-glucosidase